MGRPQRWGRDPWVTPRPPTELGPPLCNWGRFGKGPRSPHPPVCVASLIAPSPAAVLFLPRDSGISAGSGWGGWGGREEALL